MRRLAILFPVIPLLAAISAPAAAQVPTTTEALLSGMVAGDARVVRFDDALVRHSSALVQALLLVDCRRLSEVDGCREAAGARFPSSNTVVRAVSLSGAPSELPK